MIEIANTDPDVNVQPAEYQRLLGYPRDWVIEGRARELVEWARDWYGRHGQPWVYARELEAVDVTAEGVCLDGVAFASPRLSRTLRDAGAHAAVAVAVSAGPQLELEARNLWQEGKPDEYFFLEVYGSAVVEHLVTMTGARLCAWADGRSLAVLPHYSPGYPEWAIEEQPRLLDLIRRPRQRMPPVPLESLESGMLRPKKSLLAVFGVTSHVERIRRLTELVPCENCSFSSCQYRRSPYRRARRPVDPELAAVTREPDGGTTAQLAPLDRNGRYTVNARALQRWSAERLAVERRPDGTVEAIFRYEGTTCTNMGRALQFLYRVTLGPRDEGYPIRDQRCAPAADDDGYTYMCRYLTNRESLMADIDRERPLDGRPLNDVLAWVRPGSAAGCYCEPDSRQHKWGLVLETIHFALAREEGE
jgi:hypothetical protein